MTPAEHIAAALDHVEKAFGSIDAALDSLDNQHEGPVNAALDGLFSSRGYLETLHKRLTCTHGNGDWSAEGCPLCR